NSAVYRKVLGPTLLPNQRPFTSLFAIFALSRGNSLASPFRAFNAFRGCPLSSSANVRPPFNPINDLTHLTSTPRPSRLCGEIAKLPTAKRDRVNLRLDDGHSYPQIIEDLGEDAKGLGPGHLTQWFHGGYQDHLRQQDWRADLQYIRESGSELTELNDGHQF